jgi:hypothetical protein
MATFGWSAGDLVLVIQTVLAIIDALDKADGASAQYQSTTAFLKSLINTLHHLRSATAAGLDPNYTAAVHAQVDLIKNPLTEFIGEIAKYERSLGKGSTRDLCKRCRESYIGPLPWNKKLRSLKGKSRGHYLALVFS